MNIERGVGTFHRIIIRAAVAKLGRKLTAAEKTFIASRTGFVALEMIHDTVRCDDRKYVERYLNSES
jgi:hypothetical protein